MRCKVGQILDDRYIVLAVHNGEPSLVLADGQKIVFDSYNAVHLAKKFGPSFWTKIMACKEPFSAIHYATNIEKKPGELTRNGSLSLPWAALTYAVEVDHGPHDATRLAASKNPESSFLYMKTVDQGFHEVTFEGVEYDERWKQKYERFIENLSSTNNKQTRRLKK